MPSDVDSVKSARGDADGGSVGVRGRALAALSKDPTLAFVLLDRTSAPLWVTPSLLKLIDIDVTAPDPFTAALHPDDAVLCEEIFATEREGAADPTFSVERRFELVVRMRSPRGEWRHVSLHLLNLVDDPEVEGFLLQITLANQEVSTVAAFDAAASGAPVNEVVAALLDTLESGGTGGSQAAVFDTDGRCVAASRTAPIATGDGRSDARWAAAVDGRLDLRVPISSVRSGEELGVLETCSNFPDLRPFTVALTRSVARRIALVLEGELARQELVRNAALDALTGLANRRSFGDALRAIDRDAQLSVAFIDLDRFKTVNDRFGHESGDRVLIDVAERLRAVARSGDLVARMGGDEFVLVRVEARSGECTFDRDALSEAIGGITVGRDEPVSVSCTVGVATGLAARRWALLAEADDEMYARRRSLRGASVL